MKRKLFLLDVILTLLLGIYSAAAWVMLRGAGAYRVGTTLGTVLAISRPYTTLATVLLFAIAGTVLLLYLRSRGTKEGAAMSEKIAPKKGTRGKLIDAEPKLQPARGASVSDDTVPMSTETVAMETETVLIDEDADSETEDILTPTVPDKDPAQPTSPQEKMSVKPDGVLRCSNCGTALKPGQRFCSMCGTPAKGGEAS